YSALINDPIWTELNTVKMTALTAQIKQALIRDPVLREVREKVRVFDRLNHRKLFMVEDPGGQSCVIIGGRNLGDPYLTRSASFYHDGDVFFCTHQYPGIKNFTASANASLNQLKRDTADPVLGGNARTKVIRLGAARDFH